MSRTLVLAILGIVAVAVASSLLRASKDTIKTPVSRAYLNCYDVGSSGVKFLPVRSTESR